MTRVVVCPNRRDVDVPCLMNGDFCEHCPIFQQTGRDERLVEWHMTREWLTSRWLVEQMLLAKKTYDVIIGDMCKRLP